MSVYVVDVVPVLETSVKYVTPFIEYSMKYPVIADPPSLGAVHDRSILPLLNERPVPKSVAVSPVTCPGAVAEPKNCLQAPDTFT